MTVAPQPRIVYVGVTRHGWRWHRSDGSRVAYCGARLDYLTIATASEIAHHYSRETECQSCRNRRVS